MNNEFWEDTVADNEYMDSFYQRAADKLNSFGWDVYPVSYVERAIREAIKAQQAGIKTALVIPAGTMHVNIVATVKNFAGSGADDDLGKFQFTVAYEEPKED